MIHKTAIDYAREYCHPKIVELLSKGPIKKKIQVNESKNVGDTESITQEDEFIRFIDASKEANYKQIEALRKEYEKQLEEKDKEIQRLMEMIKKLQNQS